MRSKNTNRAAVGTECTTSIDALTPEALARRRFVVGAAGAIAACAAGSPIPALVNSAIAADPGGPMFVYIGCFTTRKRGAKGDGISVYRVDQPAGAWTLTQVLETVPNPQFICFDHRHRFLYSVHGDGTEVSAYAIDRQSGKLTFLNKQPTNGVNSTHLTPDPSNRYIVIGNGPGVAVFPIKDDGSLAPFTDMVPASAGSRRKARRRAFLRSTQPALSSMRRIWKATTSSSSASIRTAANSRPPARSLKPEVRRVFFSHRRAARGRSEKWRKRGDCHVARARRFDLT